MKRITRPIPGRAIAAAVLILAALLGNATGTRAAGSRGLTSVDVGDFNGIEAASPNSSISGATYAHGILLVGDKAFVTIFTHHFPGYSAVSMAVGVPDGTMGHTGTATLVVTADGRMIKSISRHYGQSAIQLNVPFAHTDQIRFTLHDSGGSPYMLLGNPTLIASAPHASSTAPAGGKTTLQLFSATVSAGGQETALVTTAANASLTIVITYPDGSQQELGPKKADADGHFAYTWAVPGAMAGTVRVVVVSAAVAQGTFTIR